MISLILLLLSVVILLKTLHKIAIQNIKEMYLKNQYQNKIIMTEKETKIQTIKIIKRN